MKFQKGHVNISPGRPKGSTRPKFSDYVSDEDMDLIIKKAVSMAKAGNEAMIKFCAEQRYGKAPQQLDMTSGGQAIQFVVAHEIANKNGIT